MVQKLFTRAALPDGLAAQAAVLGAGIRIPDNATRMPVVCAWPLVGNPHGAVDQAAERHCERDRAALIEGFHGRAHGTGQGSVTS